MNHTPRTTKHGIRWDHAAHHDSQYQTVWQSSCWRYEIVAHRQTSGAIIATLYDAFTDTFTPHATVDDAVSAVEAAYDTFLHRPVEGA